MHPKLSTSLAAVAATLISSQARALDAPKDFEAPRGDDIEALASGCAIGPVGQTAKAGIYNGLCDELTDGEKCLAVVKYSLRQNNELKPFYDKAKAEYCVEVFRKNLIPAYE